MEARTRDIVLCTDGPVRLSADQRDGLERNAIPVVETHMDVLVGVNGVLEGIRFANGDMRPCSAMFFDLPSRPQSTLAQMIGCDLVRGGGLRCDRYAQSSVSGVYVAGNITPDA